MLPALPLPLNWVGLVGCLHALAVGCGCCCWLDLGPVAVAARIWGRDVVVWLCSCVLSLIPHFFDFLCFGVCCFPPVLSSSRFRWWFHLGLHLFSLIDFFHFDAACVVTCWSLLILLCCRCCLGVLIRFPFCFLNVDFIFNCSFFICRLSSGAAGGCRVRAVLW
jgi:hypothetical protein